MASQTNTYLDMPYKDKRDEALAYLRREAFSTDGWEKFDNVTYEKKTIPGDSSTIPLVRGHSVVKGFHPREFLALISYPELRTAWDPRTQEARLLDRYSQYEVGFYTVQKGFGWIVSPRDIVGIQDTLFNEDGTIERVQCSVDDSLKPPVSGRVRATLTLAGWVLKPHEQGTEVTYVVKINPNGSIPIRIINGSVLPEIPAAISRCADTLVRQGYPPYILQKLQSTLRSEGFSYSSMPYTVNMVGKATDEFDIVYDAKVYPQRPKVEISGQGKDGVNVSEPEDGKIRIAIGDAADGKDIILEATMSRPLNDEEVINEMNKMISFIKQEAYEKARELKVKADEEFAIEKAKIVRQETNAIDIAFEKKRKQAEVSQKIAQSTLTNKSRLKLLQAREQHLQDLFSEARERLSKLSSDQARYTQLLETSIAQGLLRLLEPSVTVHCRPQDEEIVKKAVEGAKAQYIEISGRKSEVDVQATLGDSGAGGIKLISGSNRIVMDNTLDERLKLLEDRMLPEIRYDLFGPNENRRAPITVASSDIQYASLHTYRPLWLHLYATPFLTLYPLLAYAYYVRYDDWIKSEEWTFLFVVSLGLGHALSFLVTRWNAGAKAVITTSNAAALESANCIRIIPAKHKGQGEIIPILHKPRVRTLQEFRTMAVEPYPIQCRRNGAWAIIQTDNLVPGDVVSIARTQAESSIPADLLIVGGTCIVNEAMLSGESTPLLKESVEFRDDGERLDMDGIHKNNVLFGGTKVLQAGGEGLTPDGGCLGVVLRTGFGTTQGQLVRTMIFSTERVSANNFESFLFIGFLLIFAIAASWYVWVKGIERGLKKSKLLLDCILIVTSVVPPELPMELSLAVNASLVALSKYAIFCTEPFRIPFAGRVDVCCFDKTGTITAENLVVEGVAGVDASNKLNLLNIKETTQETTWCLAAAHALVQLDDGTIAGDPMERATVDALEWKIGKGMYLHLNATWGSLFTIKIYWCLGDQVKPATTTALHQSVIRIRRRFQFSSALKRMSTLSTLPNGTVLVSVKGAPETIKTMLQTVPAEYDETYKYFTRRGSRVLALAWKNIGSLSPDKIKHLPRQQVESALTFAGFLVFHCPLKPDAVETLKMLADSSHRCIMITGDNPLTAVHVAKAVEIVDREALILDVREGATDQNVWRTVDDSKMISVNPADPIDQSLFDEYDVCVTGTALKQYEERAGWNVLVQNTWVYARVSPSQKETILTSLKTLGYITLMAGDGTNDVGALKQAHIGVALLDGTPEDLVKIAEHARNERIKKAYEMQLKVSQRFNQPPPPVPKDIAHMYPELVEAQKKALTNMETARKKNPMEKFDLTAITNSMADMDDDNEPPKIKLGDASCAAPFTSKLSNVSAISNIIRQGRCTLVATIQMYKILALNCLITAYSLSVQYLDGIKFGDYQVTVTGMLMSVCFLCISRARPIEKLSRERPLGNIFNFYVLLSVLIQFAVHIVALVYITGLSNQHEQRGPIDLEAKFEPNLLNTAIYLLSLSQQVSTFAINFQGRPFREGIRENSALWWGLVGAASVAFSGATDFVPEANRWLQVVELSNDFKLRLTVTMVIDFVGCWVIELACKALFADLEPRPMITRGRERREKRREEEARMLEEQRMRDLEAEFMKKAQ
ncbi:hypothetical protein FRB97_007838 [Tulasnella sp. 331]|nr:hypothetical protein FRB97_007838 [Tulasnella sp. 331]